VNYPFKSKRTLGYNDNIPFKLQQHLKHKLIRPLKLNQKSPSVREAWPKTKFHDSLGYKSIMVIPTMQKASLGFLFFKKFNSSPVNKRKQFKSQSEPPFATHLIIIMYSSVTTDFIHL